MKAKQVAGRRSTAAAKRRPCRAPSRRFDQYYMSEFRGYAYHNLQPGRRRGARTRGRAQFALHARGEEARALQEPGRHATPRCATIRRSSTTAIARSRLSRDPDMQVARGAGLLPVRQQQGRRARHERVARQHRAERQVPKEQQLLLVRGGLRRRPATTPASAKVFEKLVVNYPKPEYWQNLMVGDAQAATRTTSRRSTSCAWRCT